MDVFPLAIYQIAGAAFLDLPVEMIAVILRYLHPESLLNVVNTYKQCMEVCKADPILRRGLRTYLKQKKKKELERYLNPALDLVVTRTESCSIYNSNMIKTVKKSAVPSTSFNPNDMNLLKNSKRQKTIKKTTGVMKTKTDVRYAPYRL